VRAGNRLHLPDRKLLNKVADSEERRDLVSRGCHEIEARRGEEVRESSVNNGRVVALKASGSVGVPWCEAEGMVTARSEWWAGHFRQNE